MKKCEWTRCRRLGVAKKNCMIPIPAGNTYNKKEVDSISTQKKPSPEQAKKELAEPDLMDRQYRAEMEKNLRDFEKFAKRIFILGPVPSLIKNPMTKALSYLRNSQRLRDSVSVDV